MTIFTIGFTQKTAEDFFERLKNSSVQVLIDIRLNNKSQLAGFAKYPDICYFLNELCSIEYIHDEKLAPSEKLLKSYRSKKTSWPEYVDEFDRIMKERDILNYIKTKYSKYQNINICLLCSEPTPEHCHRSLVAKHFSEVFGAEIIHI